MIWSVKFRLSRQNYSESFGWSRKYFGVAWRQPMRLRRLLLTGAAGAAALLAIGTAAAAAQNSGAAASHVTAASDSSAPDSLRSLAANIGLRIGSAIIPQDIETPSFAAIASSQFSVVTPGNAMK